MVRGITFILGLMAIWVAGAVSQVTVVGSVLTTALGAVLILCSLALRVHKKG